MRTRTLIASLLLALGITAFEAGALPAATRSTWSLVIPPIAGALALAGGLVLLLAGTARWRAAAAMPYNPSGEHPRHPPQGVRPRRRHRR